MKKTLLLLCALLGLGVSGAWADTWSSGNSEGDASGVLSAVGFVKIKTPDVSGLKFSSFTFKHKSGTNSTAAAYLAFSATKKTSTTNIDKEDFDAISSTLAPTSGGTVTYAFDEVTLLGNTYYYVYFVQSNGNDTYNLVTSSASVQTGQTNSGFIWANTITGDDTRNDAWRPYYTCSYTSVDLSTVTVTYSCENLSGYTLVTTTNQVIGKDTKFTPPAAPSGYSLDGVYDDTDADFDYANTNISSDVTLKLKYHLTTNPLESNKSTVASPTWCTIRIGTGSGKEYLLPNENDVPFILFSGTSINYPIADKYLWCIEGNETDGYMLYNKAKAQYLGRTDAYFGSTTTAYKLAMIDDNPGNNPRWTFIYNNGGYRLYSVTDMSHVNRSGTTPHYWTSGITYNSNEVDDALTLYQTNYPYSLIVNTADCAGGYAVAEVEAAQTAVSSTEPTTVDTYAAFVTPLTDKLTLTNGYYRIISAVPGFNKTAAWYYNPATSEDYITWAKAATTSEHQVNSIFELSGSNTSWTIKSPNANMYIAESPYNVDNNEGWTAQSCVMANEAGTVTVNSISNAQYTLKNYTQTMYANGHSNGSGTSGTITNNNENSLGGGSTWYLQKVSSISIPLNYDGSAYSYGTMYLPFGATITGAKAYILTVSGEWAIPTEIAQVPANKGVLIRAEGNVASVTATINDAATADTEDNKLVGTLEEISEGELFIGDRLVNDVAPKDRDIAMVFQNYALYPAVKGIRWDLVDGITSLTPNPSPKGEGSIYNLAGQRMSKLQKGVNIVNGKKVLVK